MEYRPLGATGVHVSRFGLGTMVLGAWGNRDLAECTRIIHQALDAGINLVDTADVYGAGENEEIVGRAIAGRRDDVVLATKFHGPMGPRPSTSGATRGGGSCGRSTTACAGSASSTSTSTRSTDPTR